MSVRVTTNHFEITGYGDTVTRGVATVVVYEGAGRWLRALKGLGVAWAIAVASVFIPVAHFLLVPGFALFGLYVFVRRVRIGVIATSVKGSCPDCHLTQSFDVSGAWRLPQALHCRGCRRALKASMT